MTPHPLTPLIHSLTVFHVSFLFSFFLSLLFSRLFSFLHFSFFLFLQERLMVSTGLQNNQLFPALLISLLTGAGDNLPYLILSCFISSCFISSHLLLSHLILSHLILFYLILSYFISCHLIVSPLISCHLILSYFILFSVTIPHFYSCSNISHHGIGFENCRVLYYKLSCLIAAQHVLYCTCRCRSVQCGDCR